MQSVLRAIINIFLSKRFSSTGYDPGLVNPYLFKVFEHLGCLGYEEFEAEGQRYFQITDVVSNHGERLALTQVRNT